MNELQADRIIPRVDTKGNSVLFLADTLKEDSITMWRSNSEPLKVGLDYYHASKPLEAREVDTLTREYTRTYGSEAHVMQRLPRVLQDAPKLRKLKNPLPEQEYTPTKKAEEKDDVIFEAFKASVMGPQQETPNMLQNYVMRKSGNLWKVLDSKGNSVAYTVDEIDALSVLTDLLKGTTFAQ